MEAAWKGVYGVARTPREVETSTVHTEVVSILAARSTTRRKVICSRRMDLGRWGSSWACVESKMELIRSGMSALERLL